MSNNKISQYPAMQAYYDGTAKHPGGRTSLYNDDVLKKAWSYLDNYDNDGDVVPSHVAFADYLGISTTCIYEWGKDADKREFAEILSKIKSRQEKVLLNNGLNSKFNSNICKLMLGKHGYHDRSAVTTTLQVSMVEHTIIDVTPDTAGQLTVDVNEDD